MSLKPKQSQKPGVNGGYHGGAKPNKKFRKGAELDSRDDERKKRIDKLMKEYRNSKAEEDEEDV